MDPIIATIATVAWQGYVGNRADWAVGKGLSSIPKIVKRLRENGELPPNHSLYKALRFALLDATAYLLNGRIVLDNAFAAWEGFKKESNEWIQDEKKNVDKYLIHGDNSSAVYAEVEKLLLPATNKTTKEVRAELAERAKVYWLKEWQAGAAMDVPREVESLMLYGWREDGIDMDWFDVASLLFAESLKSKENAEAKDAFQNRLLAEIKTETGFTANKMEEVSGLLRTSVDHYDFIKERLTEQGFLLLEIKEKVETGLNEQREDHDTQLRYLKEIGKAVGIRQEALLKDENLTDLLERIKRLEEAVIEKFNEKEEYRIESEAAPASRSAAKAFSAAVKEWEETAGQLQQAKENVESIKAAYIRQKAVFDNIDWATANDRLKEAQAIFYAGGGVKAVDDVLLYEEREKDFENLLKEKERIAATGKNFAEEELILAWNRLKDVADKNRFETAVNHFERSIVIFEDYSNLFDYAYFLDQQHRHNASIKNYQKALLLIESGDLKEKSALLNNLGILYSKVRHYTEAESSYLEALALYPKLADQNRDDFESNRARTLHNLGSMYSDVQRYADAESSYREALAIRRKLALENPSAFEPEMATTLGNLGNLYGKLNHYTKAEDNFKEALALYRKLAIENAGAFESDLAMTLGNLGSLYNRFNHYIKAEDNLQEALTLYRKLADQNPEAFEPGVAITLYNLGVLYGRHNHEGKAEDKFQEALTLYRRLASKNPDAFNDKLATTLNNLGTSYKRFNNYGKAENNLKEALAIQCKLAEQNRDAFEPDLAMTMANLANLNRDRHCHSEAEEYYQQALSIQRRLAERNPDAFEPGLVNVLCDLAALKTAMHCYQDAQKNTEQALFIQRRLAEKDPDFFEPDLAKTLGYLANSLSDVDCYEEAEEIYQQALTIRYRFADKNPEVFEPDLAKTLANLGMLYDNTNRYQKAKENYLKSLKLYSKLFVKNPGHFFGETITVFTYVCEILVTQDDFQRNIDQLAFIFRLLLPFRKKDDSKSAFTEIDRLLKSIGSSLDEISKSIEPYSEENNRKGKNEL